MPADPTGIGERWSRPLRRQELWRYLRAGTRLLYRRPLVSVSLVPLLPDDRVALVCRVDSDRWSMPGGIIEWGETVTETANRELAEEAGLQILRIERLLGVYSDPGRDPRTHAIAIALVVRAEPNGTAIDTVEVSQVQAFRSDELPLDRMAHDHERQLRDYLRGATVID